MIYTLAALTLGFVLGAAVGDRTEWIVAAAFFVRTLVPAQAVGPVFSKLNPGVSIVLGGFVALLLFRTPLTRAWFSRFHVTMLMAVGLAGYMAIGVLDGASINSWVQQVLTLLVMIFAVSLLAGRLIAEDPKRMRVVAYTIVLSALLQVILGQMQLNEGRAIWWESEYAQSWWFDPSARLDRAMGTLGHGLQLGMLMAIAAPMLLFIPFVWIRLAAIPVLLYGTLIGSARTASAIVAIVGVITIIKSLRDKALQSAFIIPLAVGVFSWYLQQHRSVIDGFTGKLQNDNGSTQLRQASFTWVKDHYHEFLWTRYEGPSNVRTAGILKSSLENGYFNAAVAYGAAFSALYALFCLWLVVWPIFRNRDAWPLTLGGLGVLVGYASTGSFMDGGIELYGFYIMAGCASGFAIRGIRRQENEGCELPDDVQGNRHIERWRLVARGLT